MNKIVSHAKNKRLAEKTTITHTYFVSNNFAVAKRPAILVCIPPLPTAIADKLCFKPLNKAEIYQDIDMFYATLEGNTRHYRNVIIRISLAESMRLDNENINHIAKHLNAVGNELWVIWKLAEEEILNRNLASEYESVAMKTMSELVANQQKWMAEGQNADNATSLSLKELRNIANAQLESANKRFAIAAALNTKVEALRGNLAKLLRDTEQSAHLSQNNCSSCKEEVH